MRDEVRVVHGISSSFLEHKCCPKKYNIIANYIPVSITNYTRTGSMVNSLPRIKEDLCMKIKEKHKRMAYTAFWTKAPPGRKKIIPKGTASNGYEAKSLTLQEAASGMHPKWQGGADSARPFKNQFRGHFDPIF